MTAATAVFGGSTEAAFGASDTFVGSGLIRDWLASSFLATGGSTVFCSATAAFVPSFFVGSVPPPPEVTAALGVVVCAMACGLAAGFVSFRVGAAAAGDGLLSFSFSFSGNVSGRDTRGRMEGDC